MTTVDQSDFGPTVESNQDLVLLDRLSRTISLYHQYQYQYIESQLSRSLV